MTERTEPPQPTDPPGADKARRIVDDLEQEHVDVERAQRDAGVDEGETAEPADDTAGDVPGAAEPVD
jgi:hypothetical protein